MVSALLFTNLLLVSAALAGPLEASHKPNGGQVGDVRNWAGAVQRLPVPRPGQTIDTINSVSAVFTIPTLSGPGDGYIWVGIDANSCQNYFRTGIHFTSNTHGMPSAYDTFYEWFPSTPLNPYDSDIILEPGDSVRISITLSSPNSGNATIENIYKRTSVKTEIVGSFYPLCQQDADWILQSGVILPNLGPIAFYQATMGHNYGTLDPYAGILEILNVIPGASTKVDPYTVTITTTV